MILRLHNENRRASLYVTSIARLAVLSAIWLGATCVRAQSLKFDFGPGRVTPGWTQVLPSMGYNKSRGFGFEPGASLSGITRDRRDDLRGDFVTCEKPFYFSVAVPEGNYRVRVILGDANGTTKTTIKAELRRLVLENVRIAPSRWKEVSFTVNVRTPAIASGGEVRLKDREKTMEMWAWDEKLTLEFNGINPAICALEITGIDVPTVFLLGDSTVCDQPREPYNSWGQMLPRFFGPRTVIANHAESGESMKSSLSARRFDKVFGLMRPGDYLFLQFGHNDQKEKGEGVGAMTTYKSDLKSVVAETRRRGGIPVLVTSMHRRNFDPSGRIINTLGDYPRAVREVAREDGIALIDLNAMSAVLYEALGPDGSAALFKSGDGTHHNNYGSYQLAKCVVEGIRSSRLDLARFLIGELPAYNPAAPDDPLKFSVPASPEVTDIKPLGN